MKLIFETAKILSFLGKKNIMLIHSRTFKSSVIKRSWWASKIDIWFLSVIRNQYKLTHLCTIMQVIISPQVLLCIRLALRACLCVESMFSSVNCAKRIGSKAPLLLKVEFGVSQASNCDKTLFPPLSDYTGVGWQYRTSIVMVWRLEKSIYTRTHTYMYTTQHESKGWESLGGELTEELLMRRVSGRRTGGVGRCPLGQKGGGGPTVALFATHPTPSHPYDLAFFFLYAPLHFIYCARERPWLAGCNNIVLTTHTHTHRWRLHTKVHTNGFYWGLLLLLLLLPFCYCFCYFFSYCVWPPEPH